MSDLIFLVRFFIKKKMNKTSKKTYTHK